MIRALTISACIWLGILFLSVSPLFAAATLELYGTFHAMGVIVSVDSSDDPEQDATAEVEYRLNGDPSYRQGFPLSRVHQIRFVGSLFRLEPGTIYDVRVTFTDPGGSPLSGVTVESSASTRSEIIIPTPDHSFYVSPDGTGTACSEISPCSLVEGLSQAQPGEEVVLRNGVYYVGDIDCPRSGMLGSPIVIRSYPGEQAILDGADPGVFSWTSLGGGVYQTTVNVESPHVVLADGERLFPYQSLTDLQNLVWGIPGCHADGTTLYVHLAGDADPNTADMVISLRNYAFYVEQDFIYFLDLTFRHYGQGSWSKVIYFNNGSDNLIRGCVFAANDLGIGIKRDSHRNVIENNEFYDTIFLWPWDAVKSTGNLEDGGVAFYDPATGRGNIIRWNLFHDDFDGFSVCPGETAGITNETDIYENTLYNLGDDGIETDGQCSNVRIWGNTFYDVLMGISLAPVYTGPVYAVRNLITRTGAGNNSYTGSPFKFNSGYGQSGPMFLFHNTADAVLSGNNGLYIKAPGSWTMITARNNIWAGTAYALENYNTAQPIDLDYDNLWNGSGGDLIRWDSTTYSSLSAFSSATGQESHGLSLTPGFADAAGGDYTLNPASHMIDKGVVIPGINSDYVGDAPDMGAFEYPTLPGDLNNDGYVDSVDLHILADFLANNRSDIPTGEASADLSGNGIITVLDLVLLMAL